MRRFSKSSRCNIDYHLIFEIIIRIVLSVIFIIAELIPPRQREILPEEVWLYTHKSQPSYVSFHLLLFILFLNVLTFVLIGILRGGHNTSSKDSNFINHRLSFKSRLCSAACSVTLKDALLGYTMVLALNGLFTNSIKLVVGRPRPDFFYRCYPHAFHSKQVHIPAAAAANSAPDSPSDSIVSTNDYAAFFNRGRRSALRSASSFSERNYISSLKAVELLKYPCFGRKKQAGDENDGSPTNSGEDLNEARKSFPSGHSSFAFAGLLYTSLFLFGQMRVFARVMDPESIKQTASSCDGREEGQRATSSSPSHIQSTATAAAADERDAQLANPNAYNLLLTKSQSDLDVTRNAARPHFKRIKKFDISQRQSSSVLHAALFANRKRFSGVRSILCIMPIFGAILIAASRLIDYHHHVEDVLIGSIIGSTLAIFSYFVYFPSLTQSDCHFSKLELHKNCEIFESDFMQPQYWSKNSQISIE